MFANYMDIIYKGNYDHPITITFDTTKYRMAITGEGGNRHLILTEDFRDDLHDVDLWVDTHTEDARIYETFVGPRVSGKFVHYIYRELLSNCWKVEKPGWNFVFRDEDLNNLFYKIYHNMKDNSITRSW